MTYRIAKSQAFPGFDVAVAAHAKEMRDWRAQENIATEHDGKPDIHPMDRYEHRQRPTADYRVVEAVNEMDAVDYEIFDDGPTPEQMLAVKKMNLLSAVSSAEEASICSIIPPGKRRQFNIRENDIRAADAKKAQEIVAKNEATLQAKYAEIASRGLIAKAATALGLKSEAEEVKLLDPQFEIERVRSASDSQHLQDQADRAAKIESIQRAAAQAHSDVEDLTIDTVDAYQVPDFTK